MPIIDNSHRLYRLVGLSVRDFREKMGVTQEELANKVGVSRTSITNIEAGRQKVPLHTLFEIASFLDVELSELLPTREKIYQNNPIPVIIGGTRYDVSEKNARIIEDVLAEERRS